MYVLTVEVEIDPKHREDYRAVIQKQARISVEREEGCLLFDVSASPDDPNRFLLYEIYSDRAAFDQHLQEKHSKENGGLTKPWIRNQTVKFWDLVSASKRL